MLRNMGIIAIFAAFLFGRPCVSEQHQGSTHAAQDKATQTQRPVPPTHVVIDPPFPSANSQPPAPAKPDEPQEKPLPRFIRPEWVIVYVTIAYAVFTWLTLRAIRKQADTMEQQATDARSAAAAAVLTTQATLNAINRQADLMEAQNKSTHERERARLSFIEPDQPIVHPFRFSDDADGKTSVLLELIVNLINDGETMAYNVRAFGSIYFTSIKGKPIPAPVDDGYDLGVPRHIRKADKGNPVKINVCPQGFGPSIGVDAKVWDEVQSEEASLHVAGAVTYDDIFGVEHKTPFHSFWRIVRDEQWGEEERLWTDVSPASN